MAEAKYLSSVAEAANVLHEMAFDKTLLNEVLKAARWVSVVTKMGEGRVITTGMGKAGHIARKFSATLSSMGIPSHYVHPGEAAHGDLGQLTDSDLVLALSTSGKTTEVLALLDRMPNPTEIMGWSIGITSHPEDLPTRMHVMLPVMKEADDYDLVPTTSTVAMLAVCDAIALEAGKLLGFNEKVFADRHHGGYLGAKARGET